VKLGEYNGIIGIFLSKTSFSISLKSLSISFFELATLIFFARTFILGEFKFEIFIGLLNSELKKK
jgi:hypothetical protein